MAVFKIPCVIFVFCLNLNICSVYCTSGRKGTYSNEWLLQAELTVEEAKSLANIYGLEYSHEVRVYWQFVLSFSFLIIYSYENISKSTTQIQYAWMDGCLSVCVPFFDFVYLFVCVCLFLSFFIHACSFFLSFFLSFLSTYMCVCVRACVRACVRVCAWSFASEYFSKYFFYLFWPFFIRVAKSKFVMIVSP